jgi:hypothetical protein
MSGSVETGELDLWDGKEIGRGLSGERSEKEGFMGDAGAYISESWESSEGVVSAEKSWRTLSHCV